MKAQRAATQLSRNLPSRSQLCIQCSLRTTSRSFSTTPSHRGAIGQGSALPPDIMSQLGSRNMKTQKSALKDAVASKIPTDMGLIPFIYISPPWTQFVQQYKSKPKRALQILWLQCKLRVQGFYMTWDTLKRAKRRNRRTGVYEKTQPLELRDRLFIARDLHKQLNTAIANRDMDTINLIACDGLKRSLKRSIQRTAAAGPSSSQDHTTQRKWSLSSYRGLSLPHWFPYFFHLLLPLKSTRVMADNIISLPIGHATSLRQVVVKIRSKQHIQTSPSDPGETTPLTEYVVIQKLYRGDGDLVSNWMIWGTTKASGEKELEALEKLTQQGKEERGGSWFERVKNLIPMGR